jgi:hypothetical protein
VAPLGLGRRGSRGVGRHGAARRVADAPLGTQSVLPQ